MTFKTENIDGKTVKDWVMGILMSLCVFFLYNMYQDFKEVKKQFQEDRLTVRQIETTQKLLQQQLIEIKSKMERYHEK